MIRAAETFSHHCMSFFLNLCPSSRRKKPQGHVKNTRNAIFIGVGLSMKHMLIFYVAALKTSFKMPVMMQTMKSYEETPLNSFIISLLFKKIFALIFGFVCPWHRDETRWSEVRFDRACASMNLCVLTNRK